MSNHRVYVITVLQKLWYLGTLGIRFSVIGPTVTKTILKLVAISLSLYMIFPPMLSCNNNNNNNNNNEFISRQYTKIAKC